MPQAARGVAQIVGKGPEDGNLALLPTFFARLLNATERDKWPGGTLRRESYPFRRSIRSDEQCGRAALRRAHRYLCYPRSDPRRAMVDLIHGHEAGNSGHSQRKPTAPGSPLLGDS
jgi:hypothetical protein